MAQKKGGRGTDRVVRWNLEKSKARRVLCWLAEGLAWFTTVRMFIRNKKEGFLQLWITKSWLA